MAKMVERDIKPLTLYRWSAADKVWKESCKTDCESCQVISGTIHVQTEGKWVPWAKSDELTFHGVLLDVMKGKIGQVMIADAVRAILVKKTGAYKFVSNRDKVQIVG